MLRITTISPRLAIRQTIMPRIIHTIIALATVCTAIAFAQSAPPSTPADGSSGQSQPEHPQTVRVSNEIMLGRVEHKTMPVYPDEAMVKGIQGNVVFKIEVDETGKITSSVPLGGDALLVAAGKNALRTFRFRPYLVDGVPAKVQSQLGFHFSVEKTADGVSGHVECMASIPNQP